MSATTCKFLTFLFTSILVVFEVWNHGRGKTLDAVARGAVDLSRGLPDKNRYTPENDGKVVCISGRADVKDPARDLFTDMVPRNCPYLKRKV